MNTIGTCKHDYYPLATGYTITGAHTLYFSSLELSCLHLMTVHVAFMCL